MYVCVSIAELAAAGRRKEARSRGGEASQVVVVVVVVVEPTGVDVFTRRAITASSRLQQRAFPRERMCYTGRAENVDPARCDVVESGLDVENRKTGCGRAPCRRRSIVLGQRKVCICILRPVVVVVVVVGGEQ